MDTNALLVAVDFSELSELAIQYAVELAEARGRRVDLLHVAMASLPAHVEAHAPKAVLDKVRAKEEEEAQQKLEAMSAAIPESVRGKLLIRRGSPSETICSTANEGYEIVIVSTHGRTGLQQFFLGSVAERVVRFAPVPVLVIR